MQMWMLCMKKSHLDGKNKTSIFTKWAIWTDFIHKQKLVIEKKKKQNSKYKNTEA